MRNKISRRSAVKLIGATAAGVLLPVKASRLLAANESSQKILRAIPSTREKLPIIGLGSALTFDVRDRSPQEKTVGDVLAFFVRRGGKVVDPPPAYGNAESLIG